MSEKKNIDKVVREKFERFSVEPPAHLWSGISGQLQARRKKRRLAYIGWISAAAVIVFAFMAGWYFNENSKKLAPVITEHKELQQAPANNSIQPQSVTEDTKKSASEPAVKSFEDTTVPVQLVTAAKTTGSQQTFKNKTGLTTRQKLYSLLPYRKAEMGYSEKVDLAVLSNQDIRTETHTLQEEDKALVAANILDQQKKRRDESAWVVGAYISPGYASHTSSYSSYYKQNMNSDASGGVSNVGGGLSVQYKTGKRLRIESGVYYASNSQSSGGSSDKLLAMSPDYGYVPGNSTGQEYANLVQVDRGNIAMNSTAGVVSISKTPRGAELAVNSSVGGDLHSATLISSGDFSQEFNFIEIPVYLRYRLVDKKFGVDVMGGLNAGIVVGNEVYINNQFGKQNIGSTDDISTLNFSGTLGLGLNYGLNRHFSLSVEPRISYYLNSINSNPDVVYRPYRFGLFTGVHYAF